ncbi:LOW QUALITY PROTEIN: protein mono-ADP-ribosyltransferase PARP4 [Pterocles gutturalis]
MSIFANCVFFIEVKYLQEKSRLRVCVKENGGVVNFVLNHKSTHVLLDTADVLSSCELKSIQKYQLPVLCAVFIWKTVEIEKFLQIDAGKLNKSQDDTSAQRPNRQDVEDLSSSENKNATRKNENDDSNLPVIEDSESRIESKVGTLRFYRENDQDTPFFPKDLEVAKYSVLGKVNYKESKDFVVIELQCSQECYEFPFQLAHFNASSGTKNNQQFVTNTAEEIKYKTFIADLESQDFLLRETFPPEAESLASTNLILEEAIHSSAICQEVSDFVELIWVEAVCHLDSLLLESVNNRSLNDVSKAEGILLQVKNALDEGAGKVALQEVMMEFCQVIRQKAEIDYKVSKKLLKQDLCQLIRDVFNIHETNTSCPNPTSLPNTKALRCKTEAADSTSYNFSVLEQQVLKKGLLMPKVVVEDHGLEITDTGNLGSGIYFSDSVSEMDGTQLLAVCDMALEFCLHLYERDYSLNNAPSGYDSVHGVRKTADISSDFEDEEFAVYLDCQVKIRYVVKFCLAEDQIKPFQLAIELELEQGNSEPELQCSLQHESKKCFLFSLPNANLSIPVKTGLQDTLGNPVPLEGVDIKARIIDFVAQDGSRNLSPQMRKILKFDVDYLINNFHIRKVIQSLARNPIPQQGLILRCPCTSLSVSPQNLIQLRARHTPVPEHPAHSLSGQARPARHSIPWQKGNSGNGPGSALGHRHRFPYLWEGLLGRAAKPLTGAEPRARSRFRGKLQTGSYNAAPALPAAVVPMPVTASDGTGLLAPVSQLCEQLPPGPGGEQSRRSHRMGLAGTRGHLGQAGSPPDLAGASGYWPRPLAAAGCRAEVTKACGLGAPPLCVMGWRGTDWLRPAPRSLLARRWMSQPILIVVV